MRAIVFVLRGCPVGWLGSYGNEWVGTPHLDRLAAEGVTFDAHVSDCPDPDAACRAWLTGRHQLPRIEEPNPPAPFPRREGGAGSDSPPRFGEGLLSALRAAGVRTVVVRANHPETDAAPPFYAAWDEVFDARPEADDDSPLDALTRALPSLLDRLAEVPRWLIWVELDRLLPPWDVRQDVFAAYVEDEPEEERTEKDAGYEGDEEEVAEEPAEPLTPWADPPTGPFDTSDPAAWEWLHRTFAAVVTSLDAELGRLFDELRSRGLDQTAAWLVTSDLGYPLGEHGQIGLHRPWPHEELIHLPLLLRFPGAAEAGRRVAALTQPADLMPTLLGLLGGDAPPTVHGHSVLPLARGQAESVRPYACSGLELDGAAGFALHTPDHTLLLPVRDPPREPTLFEKPDDRWEVNDLRPRNTELAERLEVVLRRFVAACQHPGPLVVPPLEPPV